MESLACTNYSIKNYANKKQKFKFNFNERFSKHKTLLNEKRG